MTQTRGLGRGIRALIPEAGLELRPGQVLRVPLKAIQPSRFQPRQKPDESKIQELANSIKESGLIYPLLVRKNEESGGDGPSYELIAGERRYRALVALGESEVPVVIKEASDRQALELSLIENLQREDLNPVEEATAFDRLIREFELTQEEIAKRVGKDRSTVANTLRLLKLPPLIREELAKGGLTLGHARALLVLESAESQMALMKRIKQEGLSVRQVEQLVQRLQGKAPRLRSQATRDPHLVAAESDLQRALGTKVQILHGRLRGWIRIAYFSLEDLNRLIRRLKAH